MQVQQTLPKDHLRAAGRNGFLPPARSASISARLASRDTLSFGNAGKLQTPTVEEYLASFPEYGPPPFNADFHAERRALFLSRLPANTTVVIPGATNVPRNGDVDFRFRQESNFYYLTGLDQPDAVAVLSNVPGKPSFTLVVPQRDPARETWVGKRISVDEARQKYRANHVIDYDNGKLIQGLADERLKQALAAAVQGSGQVQVLKPVSDSRLKPLVETILKDALPQDARLDGSEARTVVETMRSVKTPWEIALMKRACELSARSHAQAMRSLKLSHEGQQLYEGRVQAEVEAGWVRHGAARAGYPTIAGGGANGCVLHYNTNREQARWGDLLLLDAGGEYGYQTADITRTWPVNGHFTPAQRAIYDLVLRAQEAGIQMVRPGVTMREIRDETQRIITRGLVELGILKGDPEQLFKEQAYLPFFMHGTSHFLGMDVHDTPMDPKINREIPLQPGMMLTVEPGLYFDPRVVKELGLDPKWSGIGVRIEDDILVTETGHINMSDGAPKKPEEIEALMAGGVNVESGMKSKANGIVRFIGNLLAGIQALRDFLRELPNLLSQRLALH